jgi:hypothetical protein
MSSFRVNFELFPFSLSKVRSPPIAFASRLLKAKPKPCPLDFVVNSVLRFIFSLFISWQ